MNIKGKWMKPPATQLIKQVTFRVTEEEFQEIAQLAERNKTTVAAQARRLFRDYMRMRRES